MAKFLPRSMLDGKRAALDQGIIGLLRLAGKLSDSNIFRAQFKRLLDDPKSERFVASFTDQ